MNRLAIFALLVGSSIGFSIFFLSLGGIAGAETKSANLDLKIRVWILDSANVDAASLLNAKRTAETIYEKSGIQLTWIYHRVMSGGPASLSGESSRLDPLDLILRIRPSHPSDKPAHRNEFGMAYLGSRYPRIADVFYDRVKSATFEKIYSGLDRLATPLPPNPRPGGIFGVVMAHELGHLLLRSHKHTARGVMKPRWSRDDLMKAYFGGLGFNQEQRAQIRRTVLERARK